MKIGPLRQRIELQQRITTRNSYGEETLDYAGFCSVWAKVEPLAGRALEFAKQINELVTYRVTVRYSPLVKATMRIKFRERILEINAIKNFEERNEWMELYCTEVL